MGLPAIRLDDTEFVDDAEPRLRFLLRVDEFSDHNFWMGFSSNVADGGIFVATHLAVAIGTVVLVEFELPGEMQRLGVLGRVHWTRSGSSDTEVPTGLGLKFVEIERSVQGRIRLWLWQSKREPLFYED